MFLWFVEGISLSPCCKTAGVVQPHLQRQVPSTCHLLQHWLPTAWHGLPISTLHYLIPSVRAAHHFLHNLALPDTSWAAHQTLRDLQILPGANSSAILLWQYSFYFLDFFFMHHIACGIFVPRPGIRPMPPAMEALSLNQGTPCDSIHSEFSYQLRFIFSKPNASDLSS